MKIKFNKINYNCDYMSYGNKQMRKYDDKWNKIERKNKKEIFKKIKGEK